ncbi:hypothetical protein CVT26_003595 [Gymnopilus dilepis]|uniref:Uncharacterized protein n=1 Tax=Gymnopilus dilepis TaxID=231916 RepID=A0A409W1Y6_9AGAR|nr:hypothetical protein CVT26_003595 [Gymnopilus dilepis]
MVASNQEEVLWDLASQDADSKFNDLDEFIAVGGRVQSNAKEGLNMGKDKAVLRASTQYNQPR